MFIEEVIGAGEIAIADERSSEPTSHELARLAHDVHVGGMLSGKAGIVHVHVGAGKARLQLLRDAINEHAVSPEWLYVTHISRSEKLMLEAIDLAKDGSYVDIDTVDESLAECLRFYLDNSGWEEKLTVSSDASKTSPANLFKQIRKCVVEGDLPIETVLPFVTSNPADALKLAIKGRIAAGKAADLLVVTKKDFEIREVVSMGRRLVANHILNFKEKFLGDSNRRIILEGEKANGQESSSGLPNRFKPKAKTAAAAEPPVCKGK